MRRCLVLVVRCSIRAAKAVDAADTFGRRCRVRRVMPPIMKMVMRGSDRRFSAVAVVLAISSNLAAVGRTICVWSRIQTLSSYICMHNQ